MGKVTVTLSPVCHVLFSLYTVPAAGVADVAPICIEAALSHCGIRKLIGKESFFDTVTLNPILPSKGYSVLSVIVAVAVSLPTVAVTWQGPYSEAIRPLSCVAIHMCSTYRGHV